MQAGIYDPYLIGVGGPGFGPDGPNEENFYYDFEDGHFVAKAFQEVGYIDLLFFVQGEPNGAEYIESGIYEAIYNDTGITWTDYHMELGYAGNITPVNKTDGCDTFSIGGCISYDFLSPTAEGMGMHFYDAYAEPFPEISGMPEEYPNMIWFDDGTVSSGEGFEAGALYSPLH